MPIYDVTVPIRAGMPIYEGDPSVDIASWSTLAKGNSANVSVLHFGAHTGTHVDAPAHFIPGAPELQSMSLEILIGEAHVVEIPNDVMVINEDVVGASFPAGAKR